MICFKKSVVGAEDAFKWMYYTPSVAQSGASGAGMRLRLVRSVVSLMLTPDVPASTTEVILSYIGTHRDRVHHRIAAHHLDRVRLELKVFLDPTVLHLDY